MLKKLQTLLLLLLICAAITANAQEGFKDYFKLGFEAGLQFSDVADAYVSDTKSGMGPNLGLFLEFNKWETLKLRLGLNYDSRAFTSISSIYPIKDTSGVVGKNSYYLEEVDYRNQYLTIPFSLVYIKGVSKFKIFVQATVYYSFLLHAKQKGGGLLYIDPEDAADFNDPALTPGNHYFDRNGTVTELFNSYDFGIGMSLGVSYQLSPRVMLQLTPGFLNSFADVYADPTKSSSWRGQFKINAAVIYQLKLAE